MDNQLTDRLNALLDFTVKSLETTKDFVVEQTPLLIQEYIQWGFWSNIISASISLVILIVCVYCTTIGRSSLLKKYFKDENNEGWFIAAVILTIASCIFGMFALEDFVNHIKTVVKIQVAPRVYILQELKTLLPSK